MDYSKEIEVLIKALRSAERDDCDTYDPCDFDGDCKTCPKYELCGYERLCGNSADTIEVLISKIRLLEFRVKQTEYSATEMLSAGIELVNELVSTRKHLDAAVEDMKLIAQENGSCEGCKSYIPEHGYNGEACMSGYPECNNLECWKWRGSEK